MAEPKAASAFLTHTAEEVEGLTDRVVLILWRGARDRIAQHREDLQRDLRQLDAVEAEMTRRGIARPTE
jgi:hypothetical protein